MQDQAKITRDDLEKKFKDLQNEIQGTSERNKVSIATVAAAGSVAVVLIAYLLGRRSGRKRRSVVEIRR